MDIYLSHSSALEIWSSFKTGADVLARCWDSRNPSWRKDEPLPSECKVTELLIRELAGMPELEGIALPLHVVVPSQAARSRCGKVACHVSSATFPRGSFIRIARNVLASSPELCFVQMASELSLPALIRLGSSCAARTGWQRLESGLPVRTPLHHPARLARSWTKLRTCRERSKPEKPQAPRRRLRLPDGNDLGHAALPPASHGRVRPSPALHEHAVNLEAIEARSR